MVGRAQQQYLTVATSDLQVLHAVFAGTVDDQAQAPEGHGGVFQLDAVIELRVPTEADCQFPVGASDAVTSVLPANDQTGTVSTDAASPETPDTEQLEPQQQLIAYFGAWIADCTETDGERLCKLGVALESPSDAEGANNASLVVVREKQEATALEAVFPDREIDSPARILWKVDGLVFGDIVGSDIRVDELGTRQLVPDGRFLDNDLLPMMIEGASLTLEILESVDDVEGERFVATLQGLTRALGFADDFVRDGGL